MISPVVNIVNARLHTPGRAYSILLHNKVDKPVHLTLRVKITKVAWILIRKRACFRCGVYYVIVHVRRVVVVERIHKCITIKPYTKRLVHGLLSRDLDSPNAWEFNVQVLVNGTLADELNTDSQIIDIAPDLEGVLRFYLHNPSEEEPMLISIRVDGLSGWSYSVAPPPEQPVELGGNETPCWTTKVRGPE